MTCYFCTDFVQLVMYMIVDFYLAYLFADHCSLYSCEIKYQYIYDVVIKEFLYDLCEVDIIICLVASQLKMKRHEHSICEL